MNVVASALELLGKGLLLRVLELKGHQRKDEVNELHEEVKDLLFALTEKNAVPLVKSQRLVQIVLGKQLVVLLKARGVLLECLDREPAEMLEHLAFVVQRDHADVLCAPRAVRLL